MTFFCLGDLMVDVVARLFAPLAEGSDSPGVISYVGGGSAANTAAWLRRVGESSVFIGAIGNFNPLTGTSTLIFAFEAVVIGGLGSLWGTLVGGMALGVTQVVVG